MSLASDLAAIGASYEAGAPVVGLPFFELDSVVVRRGISAFMVVSAYLPNGTPAAGLKIANLFGTGPNGEILQLDGSGIARFQFGASSAFTNPGEGPFTVFVVDDSAFKDFDSDPKRILWKYRLSNIIHSLGDFQAEHTEINLKFIYSRRTILRLSGDPATALSQWAYLTQGVDRNTGAALAQEATRRGLGAPLGQESDLELNGEMWVVQKFVGGTLGCKKGDWGNIIFGPW